MMTGPRMRPCFCLRNGSLSGRFCVQIGVCRGVLWRCSALRRGLLCPQRQSNQNAAETSLVSDFPFLALAHAAHQKERSSVSCFSHQDSSCLTSPAGPRRHTLQDMFAASALADGRNCAVVNSTSKTRHSKEKADTHSHSRRSGRAGQTQRPFDTLVPKTEPGLAFHKTGIPKGRPLGRIFGYFCSYTKVPRRRPTPASI